jgi:hypothetical protein
MEGMCISKYVLPIKNQSLRPIVKKLGFGGRIMLGVDAALTRIAAVLTRTAAALPRTCRANGAQTGEVNASPYGLVKHF